MGGSQGAHTINKIFVEVVKILDKQRFQILHLAGENDFDLVRREYEKMDIQARVFSFLDNIEEAYAACDLIVCRAGATSIAEITSLGIASILIPYPYGDGHQKENAKVLKQAGAAIIIQEPDLTTEVLARCIKDISDDRVRLETMRVNSRRLARPDSAQRLTEEVLALVGALGSVPLPI